MLSVNILPSEISCHFPIVVCQIGKFFWIKMLKKYYLLENDLSNPQNVFHLGLWAYPPFHNTLGNRGNHGNHGK